MEKIVSSAADQQDILNALQSALNEKQQQQNLVSNATNISNTSISNGTLEQLLGQTTNQNQQNNADANSNNNSNKLQTLTQEQLEQLTGINQSNNNSVRNNNNNNRQQGIVEILSAAAQINNTNSNNNSNNKQLDFSQIISSKNNNNVVSRQQQLQLNSLTELQPVSTLLSGRRNQNQINHYQNNSEQNQQNSVQLPSLVLSTQQQQVNSSSAENFNVIYRDACNMAGANRWMVANGNEQNKTQNWLVWRHNSLTKDE